MNAGVMVGGAAAGAAIVTAGFKAHHGIQRMAANAVDHDEKKQFLLLRDLVKNNLEDFIVDPEGMIGSLSRTRDELQTLAPAFPQAKQAFDAILMHQNHTEEVSELGFRAALASKVSAKDDEPRLKPSLIVCEIVKNWLRMSCENQNLDAQEAKAYRDFCRGFVNHNAEFHGRGKHCFVKTMSHVTNHLDAMLKYLLQERRECASYIRTLRTEAYHFVLHAVQVLLLVPTTCSIPGSVYSIDSLGLLYHSTLPHNLLDAIEQQLAKDVASFWSTDCGQLLKMLVRSPHGSRLCAWMDGNHEEVKTIRLKIRGAENLPECPRAMDAGTIDPYVSVRVNGWNHGKAEKTPICRAKTEPRFNEQNPEWDETLEIQVPMKENVHIHISVKDYDETLHGWQKGVLVASVPPMTTSRVAELAASGTELALPLQKDGEDVGATLLVAFDELCIQTHSDEIAEKWESGNFENSGLLDEQLHEVFLKSILELDSLVYFFDIMFSQCLEITAMLGDLGMALCARFMRPLIDELEERTAEVESCILKDLLDKSYKLLTLTIGQKQRSCGLPSLLYSGAALVSGSEDSENARDHHVENATRKMSLVKTPMLANLAKLRRAAFALTAAGVLEEAQQKHKALMSRLQDGGTAVRSARFQGLFPDSRKRTTLNHKGMLALTLGASDEVASGAFEENDDVAALPTLLSSRNVIPSPSTQDAARKVPTGSTRSEEMFASDNVSGGITSSDTTVPKEPPGTAIPDSKGPGGSGFLRRLVCSSSRAAAEPSAP